MYNLRPDKAITVRKVRIPTAAGCAHRSASTPATGER